MPEEEAPVRQNKIRWCVLWLYVALLAIGAAVTEIVHRAYGERTVVRVEREVPGLCHDAYWDAPHYKQFSCEHPDHRMRMVDRTILCECPRTHADAGAFAP